MPSNAPFAERRAAMVTHQLRARGIDHPGVLDVMGRLPRERFVPIHQRPFAYADRPLSIGHQQTISQPLIVAAMTTLVQPQSHHRALDIGTGSGYQAAVLAHLVDHVFSVEIVPELHQQATTTLHDLNITNVTLRLGDGHQGWPEHAPFDIIIVAAAPPTIPPALIQQLAPGGHLVIPVGDPLPDSPSRWQRLMHVHRDAAGEIHQEARMNVGFVPMTGGTS